MIHILIEMSAKADRGGVTMKAIVYKRYGNPEVLRLENVPKPVPKDNEVLVRVKASSLNKADLVILTGKPMLVRPMINGLVKPKRKIIGTDFSGIVEVVGKDITEYKPGDRVFGDLSGDGYGALSEYVCTTIKAIAKLPENISYEEAASLPIAGCTALTSVRDQVSIKPGDKVLVNGASGCVGIYAVQLLKSYGAIVTGTCSKDKVHLVKEIGADYVMDYKTEDFRHSDKQYDVIIDTALYYRIKDYKNLLTEKGTHIIIGGSVTKLFKAMFLVPFLSKRKGKKMIIISSKAKNKELSDLAELVKGGIIKVKIDKTFELSDAAEAYSYYESKKSCGKVVITI
jgi:NADPH:quinone reductase-like Zn-dependent oxidoreductase